MKKCFIVCPIGNEESETRKRSDSLFKHVISPVCIECGFEPTRIDKENTSGPITDDIFKHLQNDDLVIADLTENNPNAFYEMGYRAALGKPSIHLMIKNSSIPFDVSTIRSFTYDLTDLDSVEEIKTRLTQTIKSIDFDSASKKSSDKPITTGTNMVNAQILQEIYKIQDSIAKLETSIESKDSTAFSVLADKLASTNTKTADAVMMETLLSKFIENPEQLLKLAEIVEKFPKKS